MLAAMSLWAGAAYADVGPGDHLAESAGVLSQAATGRSAEDLVDMGRRGQEALEGRGGGLVRPALSWSGPLPDALPVRLQSRFLAGVPEPSIAQVALERMRFAQPPRVPRLSPRAAVLVLGSGAAVVGLGAGLALFTPAGPAVLSAALFAFSITTALGLWQRSLPLFFSIPLLAVGDFVGKVAGQVIRTATDVFWGPRKR